MPQGVLSLLGMLLTIGVVLVLAYWCTRLIARRGLLGLPGFPRSGEKAHENMALLWQRNVGKNERLVLVRVGVTGGSIQVLTELSQEEANQWLEGQPPGGDSAPSFAQILKGSFPSKK